MDNRSQINLRTKKLGVLIRDARLAARRSPKECADAMGIPRALFLAYEEGRRSPSLPELEVLAYYLRLPMDHFWGNQVLSGAPASAEPLDLARLMPVRHRIVGALLRQERSQADMSLKDVAANTGILTARLQSYELGERPIPLPELEAILQLFGSRVQDFFDKSGPVGHWMTGQGLVEKFLELPDDLQAFLTLPVNRPYLELAVRLSEMSRDKLRSVAEGLLDITL